MKIIANAPMWFLLLGLTACGELDLQPSQKEQTRKYPLASPSNNCYWSTHSSNYAFRKESVGAYIPPRNVDICAKGTTLNALIRTAECGCPSVPPIGHVRPIRHPRPVHEPP